MKKIIATLLILIITTASVFASEPALMEISSTLNGEFYFGVSENSIGTHIGMPGGNPYGTSASFEEVFERPATAYFGYITNKYYPGSSPSVQLVANLFHHTDEDSLTVRYSVTGNGISVNVSADNTVVQLGFTKLRAYGVRQEEVALTFTANAADVAVAGAGDYVATITFDIINT